MPERPLDPEIEGQDAEYWRSHARKAREAAKEVIDIASRKTMERIAASYDKLANMAEGKR